MLPRGGVVALDLTRKEVTGHPLKLTAHQVHVNRKTIVGVQQLNTFNVTAVGGQFTPPLLCTPCLKQRLSDVNRTHSPVVLTHISSSGSFDAEIETHLKQCIQLVCSAVSSLSDSNLSWLSCSTPSANSSNIGLASTCMLLL